MVDWIASYFDVHCAVWWVQQSEVELEVFLILLLQLGSLQLLFACLFIRVLIHTSFVVLYSCPTFGLLFAFLWAFSFVWHQSPFIWMLLLDMFPQARFCLEIFVAKLTQGHLKEYWNKLLKIRHGTVFDLKVSAARKYLWLQSLWLLFANLFHSRFAIGKALVLLLLIMQFSVIIFQPFPNNLFDGIPKSVIIQQLFPLITRRKLVS